MSEKHHVTHTMVPLSFIYNYRVGRALERFYQGLSEKKILGLKCSACGRVLVPPRTVCGACNAPAEQWVEVGPEGTLENLTIARVKIDQGDVLDVAEPYAIGQVLLDGAGSLLLAKILAPGIQTLTVGARVRAVFADQPRGKADDLPHFEVVV